MITYLVSGDGDIEPTAPNLRDSNRTVRHGNEVDSQATRALAEGGRFVVVAHGASDGTVFWSPDSDSASTRWLWVGMDPVPANSRVYLYCCKAGPSLVPYLSLCECLGHCDVVPMPVEPDTNLVLQFLDKVDELMVADEFDPVEWRARLLDFVTEKLDEELEERTTIRAPCLWLMLSRSIAA